jgi:hypothetical protein
MRNPANLRIPFVPSSNSSHNYMLFYETLNEIQDDVKRPTKKRLNRDKYPPEEEGCTYLYTYIEGLVERCTKRMNDEPECITATIQDSIDGRGIFPIKFPSFLATYIKKHDFGNLPKENIWPIRRNVPFIWFVCWLYDIIPNESDTDWEKHIVSRTCKNLDCVNHEHLHWATPVYIPTPFRIFTNDPIGWDPVLVWKGVIVCMDEDGNHVDIRAFYLKPDNM